MSAPTFDEIETALDTLNRAFSVRKAAPEQRAGMLSLGETAAILQRHYAPIPTTVGGSTVADVLDAIETAKNSRPEPGNVFVVAAGDNAALAAAKDAAVAVGDCFIVTATGGSPAVQFVGTGEADFVAAASVGWRWPS